VVRRQAAGAAARPDPSRGVPGGAPRAGSPLPAAEARDAPPAGPDAAASRLLSLRGGKAHACALRSESAAREVGDQLRRRGVEAHDELRPIVHRVPPFVAVSRSSASAASASRKRCRTPMRVLISPRSDASARAGFEPPARRVSEPRLYRLSRCECPPSTPSVGVDAAARMHRSSSGYDTNGSGAGRSCSCHSPTLRPWIAANGVLRGGALEPGARATFAKSAGKS
jgi:hypothetical protein